MNRPLRVLIVEDSEDHTTLLLHELKRGGFDPTFERVETAEAMKAALQRQTWDLILSDNDLPHFNAPAALSRLKESGFDLPFIIVSGHISEEAAVAAMKAGAHDYVMKNNTARLIPAIERELREAEIRRERRRAEEALQESEKTFRLLVEHSPDVIMRVDRESKILFINYTLPQYNIQSVLGKTAVSFLSAEDGLRYMQALHEVFESGEAREFEVAAVGPTFWLTRLVPIKADGRVESAMVIATNITDRKRTEEALLKSEEEYRAIITNINEIIYQVDTTEDSFSGRTRFVSNQTEAIIGYRPDEFLEDPGLWLRIVHPEDKQTLLETTRRIIESQTAGVREYRLRHKETGEYRWLEDRVMPQVGESGKVVGIFGVARDVTERRRADEALWKSEARHRALLNAMPDMVFRISKEGVYLEFIASKDNDTLPLFPPDDFLGKNINETLPDHVARQAMHYVIQALETGHTQIFEYELLLEGNRSDYEARIVVSGTDEVMAIVRDITERKAQAAALEYQALHDILTDLPNRTLVLDRLKQAIHAADRENQPLALMIMDLNHFKDVNDALGHHHGDLLLKQVGPRVLGVLRESDTIARLGGDEFAVLLSATEINGAIVAAQKILEVLDRPFVVEGFFLEIGASIGIAVFPEHGEDTDILMRRADVAMYQAKQSGSGYAVYISEDDRHSPRRLALMGELRHAVERQELVLHYQPKIDLKAGRTVGVEALVRWNHPHHGLIPPDQFISLAEHTGVIKPLTLWILKEAAHQALAWHRTGMEIPVAVNLSVRNLQDLQFPAQITELFQTHGLRPDGLEMEITESAIMADPGRAMEILKRLRAMGIRLSIDDFGAGYSSLSYLRKMPVDTVKVDKSFVIGMAANSDDAVIVRSTIDLAHNLGLKAVAEGVESREILDRLATMGCDEAQGYFISRPVPAAEIAPWLADSPWGLKRD
ncbi:MAG: EAL domain-containing protein [Nitrospirae bacterium]|nr:EAL domain-containing protein [Nitrospirota bacterium]